MTASREAALRRTLTAIWSKLELTLDVETDQNSENISEQVIATISRLIAKNVQMDERVSGLIQVCVCMYVI
jgi:hypothetical protein